MSIFAAERQFLRDNMPDKTIHYIIFLPVILTAVIPLFWRIHRADGVLLAGMSLFIIGAYWFIQLQTVYAAMQSTRRDWHESVPDELVGTTNKGQVIRAKFLAVLVHRWHWHLLIAIALGGLALASSGFLTRIPMIEEIVTFPDGSSTLGWRPLADYLSRGILRDYVTFTIHFPVDLMTILPHWKAFISGGLLLLISNIASMCLSIATGLAFGRYGNSRPLFGRTAIAFAGLLIFGSMFFLRGTVLREVYRVPFSDQCRELNVGGNQYDCDRIERETLMLRVIESTEQIGMAFVDGGANSSAILLFTSWTPEGYIADRWIVDHYFQYSAIGSIKFMLRHVLVVLTASTVEIVLSIGLMLMATRSIGTKKKS